MITKFGIGARIPLPPNSVYHLFPDDRFVWTVSTALSANFGLQYAARRRRFGYGHRPRH